jgi:hypothetical protein
LKDKRPLVSSPWQCAKSDQCLVPAFRFSDVCYAAARRGCRCFPSGCDGLGQFALPLRPTLAVAVGPLTRARREDVVEGIAEEVEGEDEDADDTYGFPIDLPRKVLEARGWSAACAITIAPSSSPRTTKPLQTKLMSFLKCATASSSAHEKGRSVRRTICIERQESMS